MKQGELVPTVGICRLLMIGTCLSATAMMPMSSSQQKAA